jgi:hypothetical protein
MQHSVVAFCTKAGGVRLVSDAGPLSRRAQMAPTTGCDALRVGVQSTLLKLIPSPTFSKPSSAAA